MPDADRSDSPLRESDLTLNVVFVPHGVRLFRPFVGRLLEHTSTCRVRLVANGCTTAEIADLESMAAESTRLDCHVVSRRKPLSHGQALSLLERQERGRWFGFVDPDVLATGAFLAAMLSELESAAAVFAGSNPWEAEGGDVLTDGLRCLTGNYQWLPDGRCLGSSHFAIYDRETLRAAMDRAGVDLCAYRWREVPADVRARLEDAGLAMAFYDTAKLVNLLLLLRQHRLAYVVSDRLVHFGGISVALNVYERESGLRSLLRRALPPAGRRLYYLAFFRYWPSREETRIIADRAARKVAASRAYARLLADLTNGRTSASPLEPAGSPDDESLRRGLEALREATARAVPHLPAASGRRASTIVGSTGKRPNRAP